MAKIEYLKSYIIEQGKTAVIVTRAGENVSSQDVICQIYQDGSLFYFTQRLRGSNTIRDVHKQSWSFFYSILPPSLKKRDDWQILEDMQDENQYI